MFLSPLWILLGLAVLIDKFPGSIQSPLSQERQLMWIERTPSPSSTLSYIKGDPDAWVKKKDINETALVHSYKFPDPSSISTLSYIYQDRALVYSDVASKDISVIYIPDSVTQTPSLVTLYDGISSSVEGIATDWLAGNVYWTDGIYKSISVVSMKTKKSRIILDSDIDLPSGLVVIPAKGLMIWSDHGKNPKIEKAFLDGSGRQTLISRNLTKPTGLAYDPYKSKIYFIDAAKGSLFRMDENGGNLIQLPYNEEALSVNWASISTLFVAQKHYFVPELNENYMRVYDKVDSKLRNTFKTKGTPSGVIFYEPDSQVYNGSQCASLNCKDICISMGSGQSKCTCAQNHQLMGDRVCSETPKPSAPSYIYSTGTSVCFIPFNMADQSSRANNNNENCFLQIGDDASSLAFDVSKKLLLYADNNAKSVVSYHLESGKNQTLAINTGHVEGIAVDWTGGNVYWTDSEHDLVWVCTLDGSYRTTVMEDSKGPGKIAVDAVNRKLYWAQRDSGRRKRSATMVKIYVANLDGGDHKVFLTTSYSKVTALIIDLQRQWMFIAGDSASKSSITAVNLQKSDEQWRVVESEWGIHDVTLYQKYLAWTDSYKRLHFSEIKMENANNGNPAAHLLQEGRNGTSMRSVISYSYFAQPSATGPCSVNNGGCEQLCFNGQSGKTCSCTVGLVLKPGGATCSGGVIGKNFLLIADPFLHHAYQLHVSGSELKAAPLRRDYAMNSAVVNDDNGDIYWTDSESKSIMRASMIKNRIEVFYNWTTGAAVERLALDKSRGYLVYTDRGNNVIGQISLMTRSSQTLADTSRRAPSSITISNGAVFWMEGISGPKIMRLDISDSPASKKTVIASGISSPGGIAVDETNLYWSDSGSGRIEVSDLNGQNRKTLYEDPDEKITTLTLSTQHVYFASSNKRKVFRIDKTDGSNKVSIGKPVFERISDLHYYKSLMAYTDETTTVVVKDTTVVVKDTTVAITVCAHCTKGTPTPLGSKGEEGIPIWVYGAIGGGVLLVILLIACIVIVKRRRTKKPNRDSKTSGPNGTVVNRNPDHYDETEHGLPDLAMISLSSAKNNRLSNVGRPAFNFSEDDVKAANEARPQEELDTPDGNHYAIISDNKITYSPSPYANANSNNNNSDMPDYAVIRKPKQKRPSIDVQQEEGVRKKVSIQDVPEMIPTEDEEMSPVSQSEPNLSAKNENDGEHAGISGYHRARSLFLKKDDPANLRPGFAYRSRSTGGAKSFTPASHGVPTGTLQQSLRWKTFDYDKSGEQLADDSSDRESVEVGSINNEG